MLGGGPLDRRLVNSTQVPNPHTGTDAILFRYGTRFRTGFVYEDVTVVREGGQWRVGGIYRFPAVQ
jgi:hypothetical protein